MTLARLTGFVSSIIYLLNIQIKLHKLLSFWIEFTKLIHHWMIKNFDKFVVNYVSSFQLQIFNGHTGCIYGIEFSPFNDGRYLCSGSYDKTIRLWDVETSKSLHIFNGHKDTAWCVDISPLQSNNNNNNKVNNIGDCVKYGSNELLNTILSGLDDESVRLWDIRSGEQIQVFNGHTSYVHAVEYSPFNELYMIKGDDKEDFGIMCLKFIGLKKKDKAKNVTYD
ncbi:hypothetical protein RFI_00211 [Reticulomyxa filosa]|uniref:Uncharacterized protein n=1 Tax=Reticulomyxa filosa TaxID=46433 RepID=X6PF82_RETFI|nr:hypothetical protein RFI_00211 [Reticulomyxa filosa]|eukprot:ETO36851.1 hypothetical protein RFI_00211 [Reticulomyxa filosa]